MHSFWETRLGRLNLGWKGAQAVTVPGFQGASGLVFVRTNGWARYIPPIPTHAAESHQLTSPMELRDKSAKGTQES